MPTMPETGAKRDEDVLHRLKNDIAIIMGFCDLLLVDVPADDPRREDLVEIQRAAQDAMSVMPEVTRRTRAAEGNG